MSYPGNQGYYAADQSSGWPGSGSYSQWSSEPEGGAKVSHRHLMLAVVLLGACSYLVSFGPMLTTAGIDWEVRFAVLAGLLAAFGLLPRQTPAGKIVAALAAIGFLDALSSVLIVPDGIQPGWASWVVVVANGLQTAAAVGALLAQPSASDEQQAWYTAYAEQYAQAAAQYYGQYADQGQAESGYDTGAAHAQHEAHQVAVVEAPAAAASQEASYTEFIGENTGASAGPAPGAQAAQPSASPVFGEHSAGHAPVPAQQQPSVSEPEHRVSN